MASDCEFGSGRQHGRAGKRRRWLPLPAVLAVLAVVAGPVATLAVPARGGSGAPPGRRPQSPPAGYEAAVLPLFRARCGGCHGRGQPKAGLEIATRGDLLQGGASGPAVVPGSPEKSLLYQLLASGKMPVGGPRFGAAELNTVAAWIRAAAPGTGSPEGHWAFRPPRRPRVPSTGDPRSPVRNPIDAFVAARLRRSGMTLAPSADRRTLIRRVTFDLIGLPPTPEEVAAFLADSRAEARALAGRRSPAQRPGGAPAVSVAAAAPDRAYERLVDRLLADARFGERWARHWLDAAGYADSEGVLQEDRIRPNAWRYRDYVIRSFNADRPYDQFLREQIAGDELVDYRHLAEFTPADVDTLAATGFLRTAVDATRDDFNPHQYGEYQYRMLHDTQTILTSAVLGLPLHCARCHDHKYEPFSQRDYYRVQALLAGAVRPRGTLLPSARREIVAATQDQQKTAKEANAEVEAALMTVEKQRVALVEEFRRRALADGLAAVPEADRAPLQEAAAAPELRRTAEQKALVARYAALAAPPEKDLEEHYPGFKERAAGLRLARETEERKRVVLTTVRAFYDQDASPPPTPLLVRGDWLRPGDPVEPGIPSVLADPRHPFKLEPPSPGAATTGRRGALAEWLTRPDHPLTARVIVNRIWAHHFGAGLVATLDNFGRSGARPTDPALLDWLAVTLRQGGWRLKPLHRLIVTSEVYRQAAAPAASGGGAPTWRPRPRRLEAEAIRDAMLFAAGTLDARMYGAPVGTEARPTGEIAPADEQGGRRSIYLLVRRSQPVTFLAAFDAPVMETNCTRRVTSTTPVQTLALLNGPFTTAQARQLARRVLRERPPRGGDFQPVDATPLRRAFLLALSRPPRPGERAAALAFVRAQISRYLGEPRASLEGAIESGYADFCQALLASNEFVYVD